MPALRPMTEDEYKVFLDNLIEGYAAERARNFGSTLEHEHEISVKQVNGLLPEGLNTPDHYLWMLADDEGAALGDLWVYVSKQEQSAFIYDIEVKEDQRGKGYGRTMLELLEDEMRPLGVKRIALNVFGDNEVAKHLYAKQGYAVTNQTMQKWIS